MTSEPVMRPEFNGAIESIRREIQQMNSNLDHHLRSISSSLEKLREETGKVAVLEARVDALEEKDRAKASTMRALWVTVAASMLGHLMRYFIK